MMWWINTDILRKFLISLIFFLFFNASLIEKCKALEIKIEVLDFVNDINILIYDKITKSICKLLSWAYDVCAKWAWTHDATFKSVVELKLSWVEIDQFNLILSLSWDWIDFSQLKLNSKLSWVAWTWFLKIVYLLICTEFSCKLNSNSISKNRIITCMHDIFTQTEFSRTLI